MSGTERPTTDRWERLPPLLQRIADIGFSEADAVAAVEGGAGGSPGGG